MEVGFEEQMKKIVAILPNGMLHELERVLGLMFPKDGRQSMLFSATTTTKVEDLARISLRPGAIHIDVEDQAAPSTVVTLAQGYVVCSSDKRFLLLFTFLKKNMKKKVIVFFSSCNSVKYHAELLNYIDVPVLDLHVSNSVRFRFWVFMILLMHRASKSKKSARRLSSSSEMHHTASYFARTWRLVDWISLQLIGLFNSTLQMTPATTSIGWAEPRELANPVKASSSY